MVLSSLRSCLLAILTRLHGCSFPAICGEHSLAVCILELWLLRSFHLLCAVFPEPRHRDCVAEVSAGVGHPIATCSLTSHLHCLVVDLWNNFYLLQKKKSSLIKGESYGYLMVLEINWKIYWFRNVARNIATNISSVFLAPPAIGRWLCLQNEAWVSSHWVGIKSD